MSSAAFVDRANGLSDSFLGAWASISNNSSLSEISGKVNVKVEPLPDPSESAWWIF